MSNPNAPESQPTPEADESFGELLSQFEQSHSRKAEVGGKQITATVIAVSAESVFLDIGYKSEGILPLAPFQAAGEEVKPGDTLQVSVKGRDVDGFYELSRFKTALPKDWTALERAFADKTAIMGTVTAVVKGGFNVDVGVRAFMPASRGGVREAAEMEKLVGQEIRCRIIKLDVTEEDVVVDRRVVTEEEERATKENRYAEMKEGETVHGTVRSLADYGAFVDLGGLDGLLHVSDISWGRLGKPSDLLTVGQEIEVRILKIDTDKRRISLGLKQLQPQPWDSLSDRYKNGDRVRGTVTRVADFGAFVELEPGIEGLIHVSEMSWAKKVRSASDVVKEGDAVDAVILGIDLKERRISLGLKQALGDPWEEAQKKYPVGTVVEAPITNLAKFGAFVDLGDGIGCIELHSLKNAIGGDVLALVSEVLRPDSDAVRNFAGFVIASDRENFSVGANLMQMLLAAQESEWEELSAVIHGFQQMTSAIKYCPRPVVAAPFGLTLGGGAEISLHAARRQAHAETYIGLVEAGVGLIPAGGGTKEMLLKAIDAAAALAPADPRDPPSGRRLDTHDCGAPDAVRAQGPPVRLANLRSNARFTVRDGDISKYFR